MKRLFRRGRVSLTALALTTAAASPAAAQTTKFPGFALDHFDPSVPVDAFFGVPSPAIGGHLVPRVAISFDYGLHPFTFDKDAKTSIPIVSSQGYLRLAASLALWDRLLLSVDAPAAVAQSGQDPQISGVDFHPPSKPALGDLRVGLRGRFFGGFRDPFQIGAGAYLYAPTGSPDGYTGEGKLRGNFHLLLGGRAGGNVSFVWSATAGGTVRAAESPLITFGGGAGLVIGEDRVQLGPEVYGSSQIGGSARKVTTKGVDIQVKEGTELEVLGGIKVRLVGGLFLGAAAGTGPLAAIGSPPFRFVGTIAWAPLPPPAPVLKPTVGDRDGDGIADDKDACPDVPGVLQADPAKDGCPLADKDGDGVLDADDACPNDPGARSADPTKNGCPPDSDDDGIPDNRDACPNDPGPHSDDPKKNGCPPDRDGDGIADKVDACPDVPGVRSSDPKLNGCPDDPDGDGIKGTADACPYEKGPPDPDPKQNGCPRFVRLEKDEIAIKVQIQFQPYGTHKSETISPVSESLMKEIRDVITAHPEILKIEVQGHTDDMGTEEYNQKLSQQRAEAVRQWLIDAGIPASKLVAKGYGFTRPLADNRVRTGRTANRRVQFVIIEKR